MLFKLIQIESPEQISRVADPISAALGKLSSWFLENLDRLIAGLIVVVASWLVARVVRLFILALYKRTEIDVRVKLLVGRLLAAIIFAIGIFTAITIIVPKFGFGDLIAGLGFSSFIIGFATKDILNNFFSGILVLWQQPFKIGDFVIVEDHQGVVAEIGLRATELRMYDGERILIPNGDMYSSALVIRDAGAMQRVRIDIVIDYESKVTKAKELILNALEMTDGVVADPEPAVYLMSLAVEGINLSIYFWVDTDKNGIFEMTDIVSMSVNKSLRDAGIKLFPPPPLTVASTLGKQTKGSEDAL